MTIEIHDSEGKTVATLRCRSLLPKDFKLSPGTTISMHEQIPVHYYSTPIMIRYGKAVANIIDCESGSKLRRDVLIESSNIVDFLKVQEVVIKRLKGKVISL